MSQNPYRARLAEAPDPKPVERPHSLDVATVVALAWVLGLVRVVSAIVRCEGASRETDLAWLFTVVAPFVVWKEIAARRPLRPAATEPRS